MMVMMIVMSNMVMPRWCRDNEDDKLNNYDDDDDDDDDDD